MAQEVTSVPEHDAPRKTEYGLLSPADERMLRDSAINAAVARERGYKTMAGRGTKAELGRSNPPYSTEQIKTADPCLFIPLHDVWGNQSLSQIRPDNPRKDKNGKPIKYETPKGAKMRLDVHPRNLDKLRDPDVPKFLTEGIKKNDALTSQGICGVALLGVDNFTGTNEYGAKTTLPDLKEIGWGETFIVFDSDVMEKAAVHRALGRLTDAITPRGAKVEYIYLPPKADGKKQGVDDFFAAGGTMEQLMALATPELRLPKVSGRAGDQLGEGCPEALRDLVIPTGYAAKANGLYAVRWEMDGPTESLIAHAPLLVTRQAADMASDAAMLELSWKSNGQWLRQWVPRAALASTRAFAEALTGQRGCPVDATNALDMIRYTVAMEAANADTLPTERTSSRLGWMGDGDAPDGFLLGKEYITAGEERVSYRPTGGDNVQAAGFRTHGTLEAWQKEVAPIMLENPLPRLMLYAAFAPPLLRLLQVTNFGVDLWNRTSTGKTAALMGAVSVWGNPNGEDDDSIMFSWNTTPVGVEYTADALRDLPLFLDDTKKAKYPGVTPVWWTVTAYATRSRLVHLLSNAAGDR